MSSGVSQHPTHKTHVLLLLRLCLGCCSHTRTVILQTLTLLVRCCCTVVSSVFRQIHREIGGTVIRRFINQELGKQGKISAQGVAFLANINSRLNMPQEVSKSRVAIFSATNMFFVV